MRGAFTHKVSILRQALCTAARAQEIFVGKHLFKALNTASDVMGVSIAVKCRLEQKPNFSQETAQIPKWMATVMASRAKTTLDFNGGGYNQAPKRVPAYGLHRTPLSGRRLASRWVQLKNG